MIGISQEKTQKPTPKRRKEQRKKGNIFQSQDITNALGLLGLLLFFRVSMPYFYGYISKLFVQYLSSFAQADTLTNNAARIYLSKFAIQVLVMALPFVLVSAVLAIVFVFAQTRLNFAFELLKPDFSKINFIKGLKRMFSLRSLVELLKSIIKVIIIAVIIYMGIKDNLSGFISFYDRSIISSLGWLFYTSFMIILKVCIFLLAFGVFDYFYQWWEYERKLRMSNQEIKDEMKESEGDPQIKSRQKERMRRMAMLRIAQKVPLADVVIKNPTHYAVAIKYDQEVDRAPKVIAKGQDYLALKIIEIAEAHKITVMANPPLARGLYEAVKVDQEIPEEYYQAVAEIFVFIYTKIRRKQK